jgi:hypothetical protein
MSKKFCAEKAGGRVGFYLRTICYQGKRACCELGAWGGPSSQREKTSSFAVFSSSFTMLQR